MTVLELMGRTWEPEPSILAGSAALLAAYAWLARPHRRSRAILFTSGVLVMVLALISPLDGLGDTYLFSAHMLQHLLLILAVPPLLLLGLPARPHGRLLRRGAPAAVERVLGRPPVALTLTVANLWLWHIPQIYDAAVANETIHIFEHLTFLVSGTIFWWPVLGPVAERRMPALTAILYLFGAGVANSVLGILITFAPVGLYPAYLNPEDSLGALPLIRGRLGIEPWVDQQLGGLFMWVLGGFAFLAGVIVLLARWYREEAPGDGKVSGIDPDSAASAKGTA